MGNSMVLKTGGGGIDPDVLTASAGDVLKGKTAGVNGSDEPATGTLELTGNSGAGDVLTGKTFYTTNPKTKQTGTMANRGAVNQALNAGGSYTIPAGYHNGSGRVTANSLSSQTSGTATAAYIRSGYTAWVNGNKLTGSMTVSSILSFSVAAYSTNQMTATWKNPAKGPYSGVIIRYKTGSYPTSVADGTQGYKGTGNNSAANGVSTVTIGGLSQGTTYYFRVWAYVTTSVGEIYSGYLSATGMTKPKGMQTFISSGTFTVPTGVTSVQVFCVGGGGSGGNGGNGGANKGAGGGGGYTKTGVYTVTAGSKIAITVGAGGVNAGSGGSSSFGTYVSANGGNCSGESVLGSTGGSGGGGGGTWNYTIPGYGGSDGNAGRGAGKKGEYYNGASGQGSTTRAFGESSGTLYAGGGGGGDYGSGSGGTGGAGGGGNGGTGISSSSAAKDGTANTGGGGAKYPSGDYEGPRPYNAKGGSGIVIIRWGYGY